MQRKSKILGLDGQMHEEQNYMPSINISDKSKEVKTGMIMDGIENKNETSESTKTIEEAMSKLDDKTLQKLIQYQNRKPSVREYQKIGRNDPCPCGSGKKYKNCCLSSGKFEKLIKK